MKKGLFITFEGNDGSGKTTISHLAYEQLRDMGYPILYTREPGGIEIAEQIRSVILDPKNTAMDARTEALLYAASRRQHLVEKILPALAQKQIVICDRFVDSSLAYQGMGRGIGIEEVYALNLFATEGLLPDATLFLAVSVETGMKRVGDRGARDRMDAENEAFHQRVREGYEQVNRRYAKRIHVIDAERSVEEVLQETIQTLLSIIQPYE